MVENSSHSWLFQQNPTFPADRLQRIRRGPSNSRILQPPTGDNRLDCTWQPTLCQRGIPRSSRPRSRRTKYSCLKILAPTANHRKDPEHSCQPLRPRLPGGNIAIHCCQKYSGAKLREIEAHFGISEAAVSQASRRLQQKATTDPVLQRILDGVRSQLLTGDT